MRGELVRLILVGVWSSILALAPYKVAGKDITLLNVSYDPTRELYKDINQAFGAEWKAKTGQTVTVQQSHEGRASRPQARAVIDGLLADIHDLYCNDKTPWGTWEGHLARYEKAKLDLQNAIDHAKHHNNCPYRVRRSNGGLNPLRLARRNGRESQINHD